MKSNEAKYRQSYDTGFLTEPMLSEFGYLGLAENATKVMDGTYIAPANAGPYVQNLLNQLKRNEQANEAPEAPVEIAVATWENLWAEPKNARQAMAPCTLVYSKREQRMNSLQYSTQQ